MKATLFAGLSGVALLLAAPAIAQQAAAPAVPDYSMSATVNGSWRYAPTATGSEARFYDAASRAQLVLSCNRAQRRVTIAKPANAAAAYLQVWTTSQSRNLPSAFDPVTKLLSAALPFSDQLLDAMVMSRGRIAIGLVGQPALIVPPWGEVGRVIEDCRV